MIIIIISLTPVLNFQGMIKITLCNIITLCIIMIIIIIITF